MAARRASLGGRTSSRKLSDCLQNGPDELRDDRLGATSLDALMDGIGGVTRAAANTAFAASSAAADVVGGFVPEAVREVSFSNLRRLARVSRRSSAPKEVSQRERADQVWRTVGPNSAESKGGAGGWSDIVVTGTPKWGGWWVRGKPREPRAYKKYRVLTQSLPVYTLQQNERTPLYGRKFYCMSLSYGSEIHVVELFLIRGAISNRRWELNLGRAVEER